MNLSVRNIVIGVIILVLAIAIPVTVRLAQQTQIFKPRAAETPYTCDGGPNLFCMKFNTETGDPISAGKDLFVYVKGKEGDTGPQLVGVVGISATPRDPIPPTPDAPNVNRGIFNRSTNPTGAAKCGDASYDNCWVFKLNGSELSAGTTYSVKFISAQVSSGRVAAAFTVPAAAPPSPSPSTPASPAAEKITIGGVIRKPDNTPIEGAEINKGVTDPPNCNIGVSPRTGRDGRYTFTNIVSKGAPFCLRLTCPAGYNPAPLSRENTPSYERPNGEQASKTDFDFTCTPAGAPGGGTPVTVKGRVTNSRDSNVGIPGVTITVYDDTNGQQTRTVQTNDRGVYELADLVRNGHAYRVTPPLTAPSGYTGMASPPEYNAQLAGGSPDCAKNDSCNFSFTPEIINFNAECINMSLTVNGRTGPLTSPGFDITVGGIYTAKLRMRNTAIGATAAWEPGFSLAANDNTKNDSGLGLESTSIQLSSRIDPGREYEFPVRFRPTQVGEHDFNWQMKKTDNTFFGGACSPSIFVAAAGGGGGGTGPAPVISNFAANPNSNLHSGQPINLTWDLDRAVDSCTLSGVAANITDATRGANSLIISPIAGAGTILTIGLQCRNNGEDSSRVQTQLRYAAEAGAPTVSLRSNESTVDSNERFTLSWTVTPGAGDTIRDCTASTSELPNGVTSSWTGSVGADSSGSRTVTINNTTRDNLNLAFSLACTGTPSGRSNSATAQVIILKPTAGGGGACSYDRTYVVWRSSDAQAWSDTDPGNLKINQAVKIAAFHNDDLDAQRNQRRPAPSDITLTAIKPDGSQVTISTPLIKNNVSYTPAAEGSYTFGATTDNSSGPKCEGSLPLRFNVAGGSPSPSASPSPSPSPSPAPVRKTLCFAFAEGDAGRSAVNAVTTTDAAKYCNDNTGNGLVFRYNREPVEFKDRPFGDPVPGTKTFFVKFIGLENNVTKVSPLLTQSITYNPGASITTASCTSKKDTTGTDITISGSHFGALGEKSLLKVGNTEATIDEWKADTITAHIDNRIDGKNNISLTLASGIELKTNCTVNTNTVKFTAVLQCRPAGASAASNVSVKVYETLPISTRALNPDPIHEQKISIDNSGNPEGFAPKFERGKKYQLIIKAPGTLAKKVEFNTERAGTVSLNNDTPVLLKQGDISPKAAADGVINSFDKQELIRQWSIVTDVSRTGDLNQDGRINSIDYACMRLNSNSSDDKYSPLSPDTSAPPGGGTGGSPVPSLSPSPSAGASPSPRPNTFRVTFNGRTLEGNLDASGRGSLVIDSLQQGRNILYLTMPGDTAPRPIYVYYLQNNPSPSPSPSASASPSPAASNSPVPSASPSPSPATSASPSPVPSASPSPLPSSSPSPSPQAFKRVFVTSTIYDGNLGGLAGADAKCQVRATAANLGGTWKAWLSDTAHSVSSRLDHSIFPYKLINGIAVASNWTDLTDGSLIHSINADENSESQTGLAWTGTKPDGQSRQNLHCLNWINGSDDAEGGIGNLSATNTQWVETSTVGGDVCSSQNRLYCFEQ